jgi:hypothetical protein
MYNMIMPKLSSDGHILEAASRSGFRKAGARRKRLSDNQQSGGTEVPETRRAIAGKK